MPGRVGEAVEPLVREIDYGDPLTAFAPLAEAPCALFLDSALGVSRLGRYSFIAAEPFHILESRDGALSLDGRCWSGNPFAALRDLLARFPQRRLAQLPPFQGGVAGCFGYDLGRHLERLPRPRDDRADFADLQLGCFDCVAAFDNLAQRAWIVSSGYPERESGARRARAEARAAALAERLRAAPSLPALAEASGRGEAAVANFTRPDYEAAVQRVIDYIHAGDIFQANLSQRFGARLPTGETPFALYRRLRALNPAPFAAYLKFGPDVIASSSPERFLKVSDGQVESRPIKGTRPRGRDAAEDEAMAQALLASEKDRAENVMIVDLLRNDLSRVCRDSSVAVPELCVLERYATVYHLVSTIVGQLRPGKTAVDLLEASFPGGSITGAPKIRAMEIIAELEPTRRGPYCGSIGYIGFDGDMDCSIVIRTYSIHGDQVSFQVGGGIVADSKPDEEYEETLAKGQALLAALAPGARIA
jgi:para-aminobenzoate synthetase component 1